MGALWAGATAWSPGPELRRVVSSVGDRHISRSQQRRLAALEPVRPAEPALKRDAVSKASSRWERTPTPTQVARWQAIRQAQLKGTVPCEPSPGNLGSHETPYASTPTSRSHPPRSSAPRNGPNSKRYANLQPSPTSQRDIFAFHLTGRNRWTTTKLLKVVQELVAQKAITTNQAAPVRRAAQRDSFLNPSVDLQHAWVHNEHVTPVGSELRSHWDDLQPFIEAIWA